MMKKVFLVVIIALISFAPAKASHLMGGEITWTCITTPGATQGMYIFKLKVYRDCNGISAPTTTQTIDVHNHPSITGISVDFISQIDISPLCDPVNSGNGQIDCGNPQQGSVEEYIYESQPITLAGIPPAGGWHFTWENCCRNSAITNLTNPSALGFTLRAVMYPYTIAGVPQNTSPCFDSSPQFNEQPKTIICIGYPFSYSHNASDPELDSLVYSWGDPLDDGGYNPAAPTIIPFMAPYTLNSQIPSNLSVPPGVTMDSQTGEISYYTNLSGNFVTCVRVSAYKCGQLVADVYREIQVVLLNCPNLAAGNPNTPPVVLPPFPGPSYSTQVVAGTLVSFNIMGTDSNVYANGSAQDLTMEVSGGQFATDFFTTSLCDNPPCATFNNLAGVTPPFSAPSVVEGVFNWQTSCSHIAVNAGCNTTSNLYTFAIKVVDDFCPAPAITFATITIEVIAAPASVEPDFTCAFANNNGDVALSWNHLPGANPATTYHIYSSNTANGPFTLVDSMYYPIDTYVDAAVNANISSVFYYMTTSSNCAGISPPSDTLESITFNAGSDYFTCTGVQMTNTTVIGGSNATYSWTPIIGLSDPTIAQPFANPGVTTTYYLDITTQNGCVISDSVTVFYNVGFINLNDSSQNVSCWDGNDGQIAVYASGGTPPYNYYINGNLNPNPPPYDSLFTGLTVGTYIITVTDAQSCAETGPVTLVGPGYPLQVITSDSIAICYGDSNGVANAWGAGGTAAYSFEWFNSAQVSFSNNASVTGLHAGSYFVEITDALGCDTFKTVNVVQSQTPLTASIQIMDVSCKGDSTGYIVATAVGSYAPYSYVWLNGSDTLRSASLPVDITRDSLNNLVAGSYELHIYDAAGCFESYSNVVSEPTNALVSTLNKINDVDCYGDSTGQVQVVASGGVPAYSYIWDDVVVNSPIVSNLNAGLHTVWITDDWNCTIIDTITIFENPLIEDSITIIQNVSCHGGNDGSVVITSSGGFSTHSYDWSNGHQGISQPDINSGLLFGSYYVIVEDQLGCRVVDSVFISEPDVLETEASLVAHINCYGYDDGIASASGMGGTEPYSFSWNPGGQTGDTAFGLTPGVHTAYLTDAKGCMANDTVTIIEPAELFVNIIDSLTILAYCTGVNSASLTAVASGGTPNYTYMWDDNIVVPQTTPTATALFAGIYTITVTDSRGCIATDTRDIDTITATMDAKIDTQLYNGNVNISCFGENDGMAIVSTWGAHAPYTYQWFGPNNYTATNDSIDDLFAGTYSVTINDTNNCSINRSINLTQPSALQYTTFASSNESCLGAANGTVSIDIQGGSSPFTAIATDNNSGVTTTHPMQNDSIIPGITSGIFTITLTDVNNCSSTLIQGGNNQQIIGTSIATYANINPATVVHLNCYGISNGALSVFNPLSSPSYTYSWEDLFGNVVSTDTIADSLAAETYVLFAHYSDSMGAYPGCTTTDTIILTQPNEIVITPTLLKDADCFGDNSGRIQTQITGGTRFPGPPNNWYQILWNSGQTTRNINNLTAGTYIINITDANGCIQAD
nr:SprB repeat-containing protein [Flavobacteriales bacterium]